MGKYLYVDFHSVLTSYEPRIKVASIWFLFKESTILYCFLLVAELRSAIQYAIMIKRRLSGYFWETYIPSLLLSTFGALSVYIPSDIVPGRMVLSMTSFLALIGLFGSARYLYLIWFNKYLIGCTLWEEIYQKPLVS